MIIAVALIMVILVGWQYFFAAPMEREQRAERARIEAQQQAAQEAAPDRGPVVREDALAETAAARITIDTQSVDGSISLQGARLDDLNLRNYRRTVEETSPEVTLLSPYNAAHGYDTFFGWQEFEERFPGVGANDVWSAAEGQTLTPGSPVVLTFATGDGLEVTRTISVDENYMFTIADEVRNATDAARTVRPFGVVRRQGTPEGWRNNANVKEGFAGVFGPDTTLHTESYNDARKHARDRDRGRVGEDERLVEQQGPGGWFGISDHYWLTAIVVDQSETVSAYFDADNREQGFTDYRAAYRGEWREIPAGGSISFTQRVFAGAKSVDILEAYQRDLSIPKFDEAVDWGNIMWPLTKPFFNFLLHPLSKFANDGLGVPAALAFAVGILLTTVVIKLLMFPLVYHSYKQMAKMRAVLPKQKEIMERYAADKQRQQQEIIRLYQTEKVNPVSGCLPMLLTMPVFFALYKVLSVTIEMRHAPFVGWINDLSARDPTTIFNLFGLLPFDPGAIPVIGTFLMIGAWPILYGISMAALQALSPPPTDPMQAQIFRFLPIVFTFLFAAFPAGLVIYWVWSNILTILQQYVIMRRQGVETQLDMVIAKLLKGKTAPAE